MPRWAVAFLIALVAFLLDVLLTPQLDELAEPFHLIFMVIWVIALVVGVILLILWLTGRDGRATRL